jgi:hypothetical protein
MHGRIGNLTLTVEQITACTHRLLLFMSAQRVYLLELSCTHEFQPLALLHISVQIS